MQYNFDQLVDRLPFHSSKWNMNTRPYQPGDLIPLWVADSDLTSPEAVKNAIKAYAEHGFFGYTTNPTNLTSAVKGWLHRMHKWDIEESWLSFPGGVVASLYAAVRAYTNPGDGVIINDPVYPPFAAAVRSQGRELIWNPLAFDGTRYVLDFDQLRSLFNVPNKPKLMIFCSPHNAAGRVWTWEELTTLKEIMLEHGCILLSDEIHFDLVWDNHEHITAGRLGKDMENQMLMVTAASKTFNVAGLHASYAVVPNEELRKKFTAQFMGGTQASYVGKIALEACYLHSDDYLVQLKAYITKNIDFLMEAFNTRLLPLKALRPEGTYLVWVDCRALNMDQKALMTWFMEDVKLRLNDGTTFGPAGQGFVRFNMATPLSLISEAVDRLEVALAPYK